MLLKTNGSASLVRRRGLHLCQLAVQSTSALGKGGASRIEFKRHQHSRVLRPDVVVFRRIDGLKVAASAAEAGTAAAVSSEEGLGSSSTAGAEGLGFKGGADESSSSSSSVEAITAERQKIFDNIAPMYDQLNDVFSLGQHRIWKRMAVGWSRASAGDSVLDICCGSGDLSFLLAEKVGEEGQVTGLDFAAQQLTVAARKQQESFSAARVSMRWIQGDALSLPFPPSSFDAVTMGYGLRNVADIKRSLEEIRRVLKPGRRAAILDFNKQESPFGVSFRNFTLDNVVVPVARQLGMAAEYEYLGPSIDRFLTGPEQVKVAKEVGFESAVFYEISFGLMGILVLEK